MKRISFYAKGNRNGNLLHIETDGCIVNIQVGLHDRDGRQVTSVRILPDNYAERGGRWVQDGSRVVQLHEGETKLPGEAAPGTRFGDPDSNHVIIAVSDHDALMRLKVALMGVPGAEIAS